MSTTSATTGPVTVPAVAADDALAAERTLYEAHRALLQQALDYLAHE